MPWGRYRFLAMPFGLNSAPEEFQRAMDTLFENVDVYPYFDDILVGGKNLQEHCKLLRQTLTIARQENLKLNKKKLQLAKSAVKFMGHLLTADGMMADPQKIKTIKELPSPRNKTELLRFLGMATYLMKFLPNFSSEAHNLRLLLKKDTPWYWDENIEAEFQKLKNLLSSPPVLGYFDNSKPVILSVDASSYGLGAVLQQDGKPIAYASASLTSAQQLFPQIEKELMAVLFGLEKFNYYTYGRQVEVLTDHKPLLGLSTKPYTNITPKLQRLLWKLNKYDFVLTYIPGKNLIAADALSRAPSNSQFFDFDAKSADNYKVCLLAQISDNKLVELQTYTETDDELKAVCQLVRHGWPQNKQQVPLMARPYWHCSDELHIVDGLLCKGQRLVIPKCMRIDILKILHNTHRGIQSCKIRARQTLFWPNMAQDIENYISHCVTCQRYQPQNPNEPLLIGKWLQDLGNV